MFRKTAALLGAGIISSLLAATLVAQPASADDDRRPETRPTASPSASASPAATATATVRFKQTNVVITTISLSDTATSTITVRDPKRGNATQLWNVSPQVKLSGYYKRLSDLRVGFTIHLAGPRTGSATPTADHIVAPGRNKKLEVRKVTVTATGPGSITVRNKSGSSVTWDVRNARVEGKGKRRGDLSTGDVVSIRGDIVEGASSGVASIVRIDKDAKPAKAKGKKGKKKD